LQKLSQIQIINIYGISLSFQGGADIRENKTVKKTAAERPEVGTLFGNNVKTRLNNK